MLSPIQRPSCDQKTGIVKGKLILGPLGVGVELEVLCLEKGHLLWSDSCGYGEPTWLESNKKKSKKKEGGGRMSSHDILLSNTLIMIIKIK